MPELPEVETVTRDLRPLLVGRQLIQLETSSFALRRPWKPDWTTQTLGQTVQSIRRRGKWILVDLSNQSRLLVHLGMTGQFTVTPASEPRPDHLHLVFTLADQAGELRYRDIRRFGSVEWYPHEAAIRRVLGEKLGPEPFEIPSGQFTEAIQSSRRVLKALLLDQAVVAGVGNIYADEALFQAKIHPQTRGCDCTQREVDRLRLAIQEVMTLAVESRGSTIRDYVGGSGLAGQYQERLAVYGRKGETCLACATPLEVLRVAGRSSHVCPRCQPGPATATVDHARPTRGTRS